MPRQRKKKDSPRAKATRTVCFEVLEQAPTHDLSSNPEKEARQYRRGDVISVFLTPPVSTWRPGQGDWQLNSAIGTPRLVYIHVMEVPSDRWHSLRNQMQEKLYANQEQQEDKLRNAKWRVQIWRLPVNPREKLLEDRQVTMQWNVFRSRLCKKNVHDRYKPEDDTDTAIEDADIPEEAA